MSEVRETGLLTD